MKEEEGGHGSAFGVVWALQEADARRGLNVQEFY